MSIGIWQLLLIAFLVVLLFGRGKISDLMGDVATGIKSFRKGMAEEDEAPTKTIDATAETVATPESERDKAAQG